MQVARRSLEDVFLELTGRELRSATCRQHACGTSSVSECPVTTPFPPGTFTPRPGAGAPARMLAAQAATELRLALRNGEQVLLTLVIPVVLLVGLTLLDVVPLPEPRVAAVTPSVLALAVMSTAFTSQAIALGFDRRYGVIRRLAATALPRWLLVAGRLAAVLATVAAADGGARRARRGARLAAAGRGPGWAVLLVLLGCAAFGALGLLLGGTLRAEVVLAVANAVWFVLLLAGGIVVPLDRLPGPVAAVAALLPSGALAEGLRTALTTGSAPGRGARCWCSWPGRRRAPRWRSGPSACADPPPDLTIGAWPDPRSSTASSPCPRRRCAASRSPPWSRRRGSRSRGRSCGSPGPGWAARPGRSASPAAWCPTPHPRSRRCTSGSSSATGC